MISITQTETTAALYNSVKRLENNYGNIRFGLYRDMVIANIAWHLLKIKKDSIDKSFGYTDSILFSYTTSAKNLRSEFKEHDESYIDLTIGDLKSNRTIFGNSYDQWIDIKTFFQKHEKIDIDVENQYEFIGDFNPLNIWDDTIQTHSHNLRDLHEIFAKDLYQNTINVQKYYGHITKREVKELVIYFTFDLLFEYKRKSLNVLPKPIIAKVTEQVMEASKLVFTTFETDTEQSIVEELNKNLRNRDIEQLTINYFKQISTLAF